MSVERHRVIRERAYSIWEGDGRPEGRHLDHWFRAERDLEQRYLVDTSALVRLPHRVYDDWSVRDITLKFLRMCSGSGFAISVSNPIFQERRASFESSDW
jgi:hypothetical protein